MADSEPHHTATDRSTAGGKSAYGYHWQTELTHPYKVITQKSYAPPRLAIQGADLRKLCQDCPTCRATPKLNMTSQVAPAGGLNMFTLVPELRMESRLSIWRMSLPGPRVAELQCLRDFEDEGVTRQVYSCYRDPLPSPVILSVCQESRTETLKQCSIPFPREPIWYFNPALDTLLLSKRRHMVLWLWL